MAANPQHAPDLAVVHAGFVAGGLAPRLVDELLEAYVEAKRNYYLGGLRLSEVEGGRFCEAAFRLLQQITTGTFTQLGQRIDTENIIRSLALLAVGSHPDSVRLHIPRALRLVYDVRNNRDAAHLADGIDPNVQDAILVVSVLDWVLAEFVRLYHAVPPNEAQRIVEGLVTRRAPVVQDFQGFLKVLNPSLRAADYVLVLLYQCGAAGASYADLVNWVRPQMKSNLRRTLTQLTHRYAYVHHAEPQFYITDTGKVEVERRKLYQMQDQSAKPARHRRARQRRRSKSI